jgi:hypothetical protein
MGLQKKVQITLTKSVNKWSSKWWQFDIMSLLHYSFSRTEFEQTALYDNKQNWVANCNSNEELILYGAQWQEE